VAAKLAGGVATDPVDGLGAAEAGLLGAGELWTDTQPLTASTTAPTEVTITNRRLWLCIMDQ
jgi:hypothetical protein